MMINLKRSSSDGEDVMAIEESVYPWGTRVTLEDDVLEAVLEDMKCEVGDVVNVVARAEVVSRSENESAEGGKRQTMELQLTDIEVKQQPERRSAADVLYNVGDGRESYTK